MFGSPPTKASLKVPESTSEALWKLLGPSKITSRWLPLDSSWFFFFRIFLPSMSGFRARSRHNTCSPIWIAGIVFNIHSESTGSLNWMKAKPIAVPYLLRMWMSTTTSKGEKAFINCVSLHCFLIPPTKIYQNRSRQAALTVLSLLTLLSLIFSLMLYF